MICALCFGNSSLGGFHINWQLTNLETIFCVSPETVSCLGFSLYHLCECRMSLCVCPHV